MQCFFTPHCNSFVLSSTLKRKNSSIAREFRMHSAFLLTLGLNCSFQEHLFKYRHCFLWALHAVAGNSWIIVYLPVIAAFKRLVTKEVNCSILNAVRRPSRCRILRFQVTQTVRLIPALGKDIE